jgi:signal transduction histidine kinase
MSIEIIDHQFNVMYAKMAESIRFFKSLVDHNPEVEYNFNQLNMSFQHLEANHKLLKPLYRTTRRQRTVIKGSDIESNLKEFFSSIFIRNNIDLIVDETFKDYEFFTFESMIKPVFINIVNNAVYWLTPVLDRKIKITTNGKEILIMNNGEKIDEKYLEDIFTLFFTKRRDGRGIGLYLARTNLASIGYDIYASNSKDYNKLNGACFIIKPHGILTENN